MPLKEDHIRPINLILESLTSAINATSHIVIESIVSFVGIILPILVVVERLAIVRFTPHLVYAREQGPIAISIRHLVYVRAQEHTAKSILHLALVQEHLYIVSNTLLLVPVKAQSLIVKGIQHLVLAKELAPIVRKIPLILLV